MSNLSVLLREKIIFSVEIKKELGTPCARYEFEKELGTHGVSYYHHHLNQSKNQTKPTMKLVSRIAAFALTAVVGASALHAENNAAQQEDTQQAAAKKDYSTTNAVATGKDVKAPVVAAATTPTFTCLVSENYDSRYMFRGVDVLAGTGLLSTTFAPTWHITANDAITVPLWYATAVKSNKNASQYRELDVPINYLHTFDNGFSLGAGYTLYNYFNLPGGKRPSGTGIQNEVNVTGGYTKKVGDVTLNSSLTYYYELGTANQYTYGSINPGSSFLTPSLGASIPLNFIKKDGSVTFNPNTQYNFSFVYNTGQNNGATDYVSGANNWQFQLPVTWQVTKVWSVTGYWAYSYQGLGLTGVNSQTASSLGWAGCSIGASF